MRILVILSPTGKWGTKTSYTALRKFLISDGYLRIAPDVFMRITENRKSAEKHYRRISKHAPKTGAVLMFRLTEKQFAKITYVSGGPNYQESTVGANCHVML